MKNCLHISSFVLLCPNFVLMPGLLTVKKMKYLIVTGGVVSGLGKGITISSLGVLLKAAGYSVTAIKVDPYLVRPSFQSHIIIATNGGPEEYSFAFVPSNGSATIH
jgi:hypothetical protein